MLQMVKNDAPPEIAADFDVFWALYPRRVAKADARRAWAKISPDLYPAVIAGLQLQLKHNQQWQRDGGQYIPYPATWLNGERWEDEMEVRVPASSKTMAGIHALESLKSTFGGAQ